MFVPMEGAPLHSICPSECNLDASNGQDPATPIYAPRTTVPHPQTVGHACRFERQGIVFFLISVGAFREVAPCIRQVRMLRLTVTLLGRRRNSAASTGDQPVLFAAPA